MTRASEEGLPGGLPGQLGPFLLVGASVLWLQLKRDSIPERFPIHFGVDGQPNAYAHRTAAGIFGLPLFAAVSCCLMLLFAWLLARHGREGAQRKPTLWMLLAAEYLIALSFSGIGLLLALRPARPSPLFAGLVVAGLELAAVAVLIFAAAKATKSKSAGSAAAAPDANWKRGFYSNAEDSSLFVEKRKGLGYTLNMAHPAAWPTLLSLIGLPILLVICFVLLMR